MRASHYVAGIVGWVACVAMWLFARDAVWNALGADARGEHTALWIYTPHVPPGRGALATKVRVERGAWVRLASLTVTIDGAPIFTERDAWTGKRAGKYAAAAEEEIDVPLPASVQPGVHRLVADVTYEWRYDGTSAFPTLARSERESESLATTLDAPLPAAAPFRRLGSLAFAAAAAFVVLAIARRGFRPFVDWLNEGDVARTAEARKGAGALLGPFTIASIVAYATAGYPLFVKPLLAASGVASTWAATAFGAAWLAVPVYGAVVARRRERAIGPRVVAEVVALEHGPRVVPTEGPEGGYREPAAKTVLPAKKTLDHLAVALRARGLRVGRRGDRLAPRIFGPALAVAATDPDDLGAGLRVEAPVAILADVAAAVAGLVGPIELRLDGRVVPVAPDATDIAATLRPRPEAA